MSSVRLKVDLTLPLQSLDASASISRRKEDVRHSSARKVLMPVIKLLDLERRAGTRTRPHGPGRPRDGGAIEAIADVRSVCAIATRIGHLTATELVASDSDDQQDMHRKLESKRNQRLSSPARLVSSRFSNTAPQPLGRA